ncbi:DEAD/DEAH box helicase [Gemmatimonas sp. UBA7669]|uniref:DEAD/DEAH box helicase n=1 Tax=Gemmatimonas sp. UBA7669 TaxID=1946568 RepID=UPI0025BFB511|nr:DEAD/DEAH box helicase family protein [Gemmatimonas sp. UBA7669]
MNERAVREIAQRLSLRKPQHDALAMLGKLATALQLPSADADRRAFAAIKTGDREAQREACTAVAPSLISFDRAFPSATFALATGVGKTRLMGAQIAYLHRVHGIRDFLVVAPNLTIYDKLRRDFTQNTPKYVFAGLPEFAATPPELISEDWDTGRGVRGAGGDLFQERVFVNVLNISKFDSKEGARMRTLRETIGTSYFEYLAGLPDLVVLMDESHRYRAAAAATALNDLNPLLGIELTATPQVQRGTRVEPFSNVAYRYGLANAIADGFVKKPAVAGRSNHPVDTSDVEALDRIKLEDALVLHEQVKAELIAYADREGVRRVKPFVLVIARDTQHAEQLQAMMSARDFHSGLYAGRVITVHSNRTGTEKDEVIQRLLRVEDADEPTEIVIHVEMLKEGWDVTNLYTVVPLRAANSRTLVEQSIGRGLRLPYGKPTGVPVVDRLTIVAHDRFQEIVDEAERGDSPFKIDRIDLSEGDAAAPLVALTVVPTMEAMLSAPVVVQGSASSPSTVEPPPSAAPTVAQPVASAPPLFASAAEARVGQVVYGALDAFRTLPSSTQLADATQQAAVAAMVRETLSKGQLEFGGDASATAVDVERVVSQVLSAVVGTVIDIPRILLQPLGETIVTYDDVPLPDGGMRFVLPEQEIVVRELQSREQFRIAAGLPATEARIENYIVRALIDEPDIDYDAHGDLLYRRAAEAVEHIRTYEPDEDKLHGLVAFHARSISAQIARHLRAHRHETPAGYEPVISHGWSKPEGRSRTVARDEPITNYREPVTNRARIRQMRFGYMARCLFPEVQFDSDGERRFAVLLEDSADRATRWFRPGKADIRIYWSADRQYLPDFIVETSANRLIVEIKDPEQIVDTEVQAKARAAVEWCQHANAHAAVHGGKPWRYLLIPDEAVLHSATINGLVARFAVS